MTEIRLDRVSTFGDQLSFLIPHDWIESNEETDHYLYHAPHADSGWFRVSLLTLRGSGKASPERLREIMSKRARKEGGRLFEFGSNLVVAWEQLSQEDGVPIRDYWWAVSHSHSPDLGHEALFSYTVPRTRQDNPETNETVALLSRLVSDARFALPSKSD